MNQPRTFDSLVGQLKKSAAARKTVKSAADATDPQDKGTISIPKDPDAAPAKQNTPESKTNADTTPTLPAPTPAKTVTGEESGDLSKRAAAIATSVSKLIGKVKGAATTGKQGDPVANTPAPGVTVKNTPVAPNLPPNDKVNDGKSATPTEGPKDPDQKTAPTPKTDSTGPMPENAENKNSKMASFAEDPELFKKVASLMLSTEEGRNTVLMHAQRAFGAEVATDMIKAAAQQEAIAQQLEAEDLSGMAAAEEMWKKASESERAQMVKVAEVHALGKAKFATQMEQDAYEMGVVKAAAMADAGLLGEELPPEAAAPPSEEITIDDVMQVLDALVQSGQLPPEVAAQILQSVQGGGAEGGAPAMEGGAPPEGALPPEAAAPAAEGALPPEAAEAPPEEPPAEEPEAEKSAAQILAAAFDSVDKAA